MNGSEWGSLILLAVLLGLSALYSMSETAMMALSRGKVRALVDQERPHARWLERLAHSPNRILGTVLFGNNISNVMASTVATAFFIGLDPRYGVVLATVVMSVAVLVLAEIAPKTYAAHSPEMVALRMARFMEISARLFYPVVQVLTWFGVGLVRMLGGKTEGGRLLTEEEIRNMVEVGEEQGLLEENEREMIQGIFDLGDTMVREVMVPRIDIDAVPETATLGESWDAVIHYGHSRLPVYEGTIDNVIGVIFARDILAYLKERDHATPIKELIRPVLYVPESKRVNDLLADFRRARTQIAVVLDEYGGTAGMVTMQDVLEEIVGEIHDEYDTEEVPLKVIDPDTLEVDGTLPIDDLNEYWDLDLPHEDFDTVGGLILHLLGRAPVEGETVREEGLEFTAAKVVGRRIVRAVVRRAGGGDAGPERRRLPLPGAGDGTGEDKGE
ncbi:HlyC/CorC family transporter [Candidatus Hydrogenisulfobacillus filiaventi]|uniref:HlyC/CorC family transporter n=1 Tax=Candidatus Hydrogenisulfobacillus filiaventi TaxID=2707344 RepID=A0A6F8ZIB4_9FIRM|nr:hemolysin family protein [Bacillota bacterium]CAB1129619.1 HlyC/CorC family transporter [Candidatus Hydrogenisulfobacillus filiaventi]